MTITKFRTYRVSGTTYPFRNELKRVGRWDAPSKTWIIETGGMKTYRQAEYILRRCKQAGCVIEEL